MFGENEKISTPAETLTPAAQGAANVQMNAAIAEAVRVAVAEATKGIFAGLAPTLAGLALTPEKMEELKRPWVDPKVLAREARENKNSRLQLEEQRLMDERRKSECGHLDKNNNLALGLLRNYHDRQPRGVCMLCNDLIHPKEWRISAPDEHTGETKAYLVPAHKDYALVKRLISMSGMA